MWIVRLALRRPYTFVVMAMAIVLLGLVAIFRMPTDIFPEVDIPVISVIWQYPGMSPGEMEGRMVRQFEGFLTTTVNDIEHIESQSLNGVAVIRVYFQPGAKIEEAEAQVVAAGQTALRQMPPGSTPPLVLRYSASTVPILQLSMGLLTRQLLIRHSLAYRWRRLLHSTRFWCERSTANIAYCCSTQTQGVPWLMDCSSLQDP